MLRDNPIFQEDMDTVLGISTIPWNKLRGKTVFITGATGLIGYTLASVLLQYNLKRGGNIRVIALVRDREKAKEKFSDWLNLSDSGVSFLEGAVEDQPDVPEPVDYIIHCACPTGSAYFVSRPVETIETIYAGTKYVLELAREKQSRGVVFLSSMEVYGEVKTREKLREQDLGRLDITSPRSCYPEGKRLAENLCCAYAKEYGVPVTIARLAQTFGPGVDREDGRVFAYMARCALAGRPIILKTKGETERNYLYTAEAAAAILIVLLKGRPGEVYTAANEKTYCSIWEMARLVAKNYHIDVAVEEQNIAKFGYADTVRINLDSSKLRSLGWRAETALSDMYRRMIDVM